MQCKHEKSAKVVLLASLSSIVFVSPVQQLWQLLKVIGMIGIPLGSLVWITTDINM